MTEQLDMAIHGTSALQKLYNVMSELDWIPHNAQVSFQGANYSYTSEQQMVASLRPLFRKHRLIIVPVEVKQYNVQEKRIVDPKNAQKDSVNYIATGVIVYRVYCVDTGDYVQVEMLGAGADSLDKFSGKLATQLYKYAFRQMLLMGLGEDSEAHDSESGQLTGTTAITHPAHALQQIFNNARLDIKSNLQILAALSQHDIVVSDTLEPTPELKKVYGKIAKIASSVQSGKSLEDAIELFNESMRN